MLVPSGAHQSDFSSPLQFRVLGPDSGPLAAGEVRRLFRGQRLTAIRRRRLDRSSRIIALQGARIAGIAAFERGDRELRVYEFAVDSSSAANVAKAASGLIEALELACLAAGARRLIMLPRATAAAGTLELRGYRAIAEGSTGTWFEKTFA